MQPWMPKKEVLKMSHAHLIHIVRCSFFLCGMWDMQRHKGEGRMLPTGIMHRLVTWIGTYSHSGPTTSHDMTLDDTRHSATAGKGNPSPMWSNIEFKY